MNCKHQIIAGFPGVGKTTFVERAEEQGVKVLDSDSSKFPKAEFPSNYLVHIHTNALLGHIVLCSTHNPVLSALSTEPFKPLFRWALIYPDRSLKEEYLQRYRDRGSPEQFVDLMNQKWDSFIDDVEAIRGWITRCRLQSGEYLSDRIGRLI